MILYWIATQVYSLRAANNHPSRLMIQDHVLESPIHANYLWTMLLLMLGMMMNGWLFYFCLLFLWIEAMMLPTSDVMPNPTWKWDDHRMPHEYVMASFLALSFFLIPDIMELFLSIGLLSGFYYLDFILVRPFLVDRGSTEKEE